MPRPAAGKPAAGLMTSPLSGGVFEFFFILIVFVCILLLTYFVTKFAARRASGRLKSKYIEVVDTLSLGPDARLLILKVGDELFLASKSQKQLALLTKLEMAPGDVQEDAAHAHGFAESLRSVLESKLGLADKKRDDDKNDL